MFIDLTLPLSEQTPLYPGDKLTTITSLNEVAKDGFSAHYFAMGTHTGTHIDAPAHMISGGRLLSSYETSHFTGPARYVDVRSGGFEAVKQLGDLAGTIVIFNTGMGEKVHLPVYFETYPVMTKDIADYLVEQKVKMVGIDTFSVDNTPEFAVHKTLLSGDVLVIENLTNLRQLADKQCTIYAWPLSLQLEAAPARVIAEVK